MTSEESTAIKKERKSKIGERWENGWERDKQTGDRDKRRGEETNRQ